MGRRADPLLTRDVHEGENTYAYGPSISPRTVRRPYSAWHQPSEQSSTTGLAQAWIHLHAILALPSICEDWHASAPPRAVSRGDTKSDACDPTSRNKRSHSKKYDYPKSRGMALHAVAQVANLWAGFACTAALSCFLHTILFTRPIHTYTCPCV